MLTYGDGVANVDLRKLVALHEAHGKLGDHNGCAATRPFRRAGVRLKTSNRSFILKKSRWATAVGSMGAFSCWSREFLGILNQTRPYSSRNRCNELAADGQLHAYRHVGFWWAMDTLRDKRYLDGLCSGPQPPPWKQI